MDCRIDMESTKKLTQERLKKLLVYDQETGVFTWKESCGFASIIGMTAGHPDRDGYIRIGIDKKRYAAHRLAWLYVYGYFPENTIDHLNRNRKDNRVVNLREATRKCQSRNCGEMSNNTSGIKGVVWDKARGKWIGQIKINRDVKKLGWFADKLDAAYTRYAAEQCLGFHDCDINSSAKRFIENHWAIQGNI